MTLGFSASFPDKKLCQSGSEEVRPPCSRNATHRFPMNCTIRFSIFLVNMAHQLHDEFRDAGFQGVSFELLIEQECHFTSFHQSEENLWSGRPQDSIAFSAVAHEFPQYFYDSLVHDFLESNLEHCIGTPRSDLSLWSQQTSHAVISDSGLHEVMKIICMLLSYLQTNSAFQ